MVRKKILFLLFIVIFFILAEFVYFPLKNSKFKLINDSVYDTRLEELNKKEENLVNAYGFDDYINYGILYSKVLFRDVYHFNKEITIYKGSRDNIKKNYLVIDDKGLIGVVSSVDKNTSRVQLLYNEDTSLSVKIGNSYGILKCVDNNLIVEGIDNKEKIEEGEVVKTSDISIYPEGIKIGTVESIFYDKYEIEKKVIINPYVSFDDISYVGIIMDLRGQK